MPLEWLLVSPVENFIVASAASGHRSPEKHEEPDTPVRPFAFVPLAVVHPRSPDQAASGT